MTATLPETFPKHLWSVTWLGPPGNEGPYGGVGAGTTIEEAALDVIGGLDALKTEGEWFPHVVHVVRYGYISRALAVSVTTIGSGSRRFHFEPAIEPSRAFLNTSADAVHAPDPPPGPKGPTKAAVEEAVRCIKKSQEWLVDALGELTGGGFDLDEAQNWLRETRLYVMQAEQAIQYARDIRGHRQAPTPAPVVQEWGPEPGQRPVPTDEERASAESKAERDAYDLARDQAARAGHPDPHGAALVMLLAGKRGST